MMEPVAKKRVRLPDIGEELFERYPSMSAQTHEAAVKGYARKALSDAEARIRELEAVLDEKEIASGLTGDGNLWRYWAAKAKDLALKNADIIRERDAAEALLKEAGKVILDYRKGVPTGHQPHMIAGRADAIIAKIGGKDE